MYNIAWKTPSEIEQFIFELFNSKYSWRQPPLLHGRFGIGKSQSIRRVATRMDADFIDLRLGQLEAPDLRGLTMIDIVTNQTRHIRPEFLPVFTNDPHARKIILFLDELTGTHDSLRKPAFELVLDRRVGPHVLGDNVRIVAAGNTEEHGTDIHALDTATADRFCHVGMEPTVEGFIAHARDNNMHPAMISWISNNRKFFAPAAADFLIPDKIALASSRSFERGSEALHDFDEGHISRLSLDISLKGWWGEGIANAFLTDMDDASSCYDLNQLLNAPADRRIYPSSAFGQLTLSGNLISWLKGQEGEAAILKALDIMMCMPETRGGAAAETKHDFINQLNPWLVRSPGLTHKLSVYPAVERYFDEREKLVADADAVYTANKAARKRAA